jgi:hypothetical protein
MNWIHLWPSHLQIKPSQVLQTKSRRMRGEITWILHYFRRDMYIVLPILRSFFLTSHSYSLTLIGTTISGWCNGLVRFGTRPRPPSIWTHNISVIRPKD